MKKIFFISLIAGLLIANTSCKKDDTGSAGSTTGNISTNISKFASTDPQYATKIIPATASLTGTKIEIHSKASFDALVKSVNYNGASVSFSALAKGKYYVMAWKDNDSNTQFSDGDYFGFVEKAVVIKGGENLSFNIQMYILKN